MHSHCTVLITWMILRFFRSNQPITILTVPILAILLWVLLIINTNQTPGRVNLYPNPAFEVFPLHLFTKNYIFLLIVPPVLILVNAFYFARVLINYMIIKGRTQLPAFFYLVLVIPSVFQSILVPWNLFASFFFILTIDWLFGAAEKRGLSYRFFDGGMLFAVGTIFDWRLVYFVPFLILIQILLRPVSWREILFVLFGFALPYFLIFSYLFLTNADLNSLISSYKQLFDLRVASIYSLSEMLLYGIFLMSIVIASLFALSLFPTLKIHSRKYLQLFFILFLNVVIATLLPVSGKELFVYMAIPISFILSLYFASCRITYVNQAIFLINIFGASVVVLMNL